ncbi:PAS domain S-box-containing protein [Pontibacter aydingkolensis]|uniref:histidine kinase n=1 Tax=Pontibacter aydingkolensis TaxID=1911536 RepID=A0ABS7CYJ2_9BACT|nr:PAS domain-containing sensor histidine kinase [Pontibacter aydingkolensis]MBW7468904.1 PAS domain-containing sensor histidine kinase [Pontibacter aydingkolensis]
MGHNIQNSTDEARKKVLREFENLNMALFHNHPDAIYMLDLEGRFLMVNEVVCQVSGVGRELLLGSSFEPLIHLKYRASTIESFEMAIRESPQRYETAVITPEGIKYLDVTNFPFRSGDQVLAVFGIAKDITEKRQKEVELREQKALLEVVHEEVEIFRKVIAHDLRKPVANALGFARLLKEGVLAADEETEAKCLLLGTVEALDTMVRDLNKVMALRSKGEMAQEKVEVLKAVSELLISFESEINNIKASISVHVDPGLHLLTVKAYFYSILRNLIANALKYHAQGHLPEITIKAWPREGSKLAISVGDNGIGMDMEAVADRLFKMHTRFAPHMAEGSGLGLYIVNQQVKLLNGTVTVSSEPGIGSEFTVCLPLN